MSAYLTVAEVQALIEDRAKTESAIRNLSRLVAAHSRKVWTGVHPPESFILVSVDDLRRVLDASADRGIPA